MDTFSPYASADLEPRLSASGQAELRDAVLRQHATLPFDPGAAFTRILWLLFLCSEGIQTRAVLPVDNRLDLPDSDNIAGLCDLLANFLEHPMGGETALVILHRPGTTGISDADKYIFRILSEAAASRDTSPWTFYVTGPDGVHKLPGRCL